MIKKKKTQKNGNDFVRVNISLRKEVLEIMDKTAKELGLSRSALITISMMSVKAFDNPEMSKALEKTLKNLMKDFTK